MRTLELEIRNPIIYSTDWPRLILYRIQIVYVVLFFVMLLDFLIKVILSLLIPLLTEKLYKIAI